MNGISKKYLSNYKHVEGVSTPPQKLKFIGLPSPLFHHSRITTPLTIPVHATDSIILFIFVFLQAIRFRRGDQGHG